MRWLFLLIASLFEALWTYSVKYFSLAQLKTIRFDNFYKMDGGLPALIPLLGYILFGVGNIFFFSLALKTLSNSTAYSVWTAMTIIVLKLIELLYFKQKVSVIEFCFILMIIVGIMGLKFYGPPEKTV
ncbi:MAG: SMR family transporter [Mucilaginibacter sp.]|uniref:DMT family transporter n=1 Tax=Mucilaginibacter sp. TaxID=1882438 RepID=UPI003264D771